MLVHGRIAGNNRLGHAWIESQGRIWDPVSNKWFPRQKYLSGTLAVADKRYSLVEMSEQIAASGHSGPWHVEKCKLRRH